jgi:hypothetical protein
MTKLHVSEIYVRSHDKSCNGVNLMQHDGSPMYVQCTYPAGYQSLYNSVQGLYKSKT